MNPQILGVSGSPIKNSNTDRLVKAVLDASGLASEFVKLRKIQVRPCIACLGCGSSKGNQLLAGEVKKGQALAMALKKRDTLSAA